MEWFDRAQQQLDEDHENGLMTDKEYQQANRELAQEYREAAMQAAEDTFNSYY